MGQNAQKQNAAAVALEMVEDGMVLGLGSGSTAEIFIEMLGEEVEGGLNVSGVATSEQTRLCAERAGVEVIPIEHAVRIDLTIDGADEADEQFRLIKGGGGRLLREKIIANASDVMAVIVDESKMVETLGAFPLPVEVDPFGFTITAKKVFDALRESGCETADVTIRENSGPRDPFITDGGHFILDCQCKLIPDPERTAYLLNAIPGVVEHGLFLNLARYLIIGAEDGADILERV